MDELISVRLTGHDAPVLLEPRAHAALLRYLDEARTALGDDPDREEVVRDLESAVGDRLVERVAAAPGPVSEAQVRDVLADVGPVGAGGGGPIGAGDGALPGAGGSPPRGRFWCRIQEGRWFGGVCLGIAAYSELRVDWVRTVILLLALATGGVLGLVYLVLLLVLPVVPDVAEYERRRDAPSRAIP